MLLHSIGSCLPSLIQLLIHSQRQLVNIDFALLTDPIPLLLATHLLPLALLSCIEFLLLRLVALETLSAISHILLRNAGACHVQIGLLLTANSLRRHLGLLVVLLLGLLLLVVLELSQQLLLLAGLGVVGGRRQQRILLGG